MADLGAHLSQRGTLVDTNNDGIADGFAHTVKNVGNFTTFSLTNGVLSLAPAAGGSAIGGADTQVQFNDAGSLNGESTFVYNKTSNTLTVSNLTVSDTLTVTTTTTLNSNTVTIGDSIIVLNSDATGSASANAGIEIERGDDANVQLLWDETNDQWDFDGFALGAVGKVYGAGSGAIYTFTSDTDTGVEHTGTDQLGLLVGNTRVLMVNANGVNIAPAGATGAGSNQALLVDDIVIDTQTISTSGSNKNVIIAPHGSGSIELGGVSSNATEVTTTASAHNVVGTSVTISSGSTTAGTTNNIAGGSLTLASGQGKGTGAGGSILFKTADGGSSGSTLNPLTTKMTILDSGFVGISQNTPTVPLHVGGDAIISGNLTVSGTSTTVSTTNTFVTDAVLTLNSGESGNGVTGGVGGFEVDRGENSGVDNPLARFVFDESDDKWKVQLETGSGSGSYAAAGLVASTIEGTTGTFSGDVAVDTDTLFVDVSTERVGINVASPTEALDITGSIKASANIEIGGNGDVSGRLNANLTTKVQNETGSTISKGSPVYISATHASGRPQVSLTDADASTNKYPAIGLVYADISTGSQGYALTFGVVEDVPASLFVGTDPSVGDTLYISATEGKITVDRPSSSTVKVQNIGRIVKTNVSVSGNSGTAHILVQGPGRTNDIPNDIGDEDIIAAASATNYTPSASTVEGHLAGIDTALGSVDTDTVRTVTAGGNTLGASETLAFTAGSNVTITESGGAVTIAASGGGSGASVAFKTIAVSGQSDVVADAADDTLTLTAGSNVTITTNATSDTITIASTDTDTTDAAADVYNYVPIGPLNPPAASPWQGAAPTTTEAAINRLAEAIYNGFGAIGPGGPIP